VMVNLVLQVSLRSCSAETSWFIRTT